MRVLVAASSPMARAGLESILRAEGAFQVVGAVPTASVAASLATLHPDVLVMEGDGWEALPPGILGNDALAVVLVGNADVAEVLPRGVRAVLPRDAQEEVVVAAVRAAGAGLLVLPVTSLPALMPTLTSTTSGLIESLTPREIEVLSMMAEGAGNKEIAHRLGISEHTVKFHVGSIFGKMGVASRTEAVTTGIRQGLIPL